MKKQGKITKRTFDSAMDQAITEFDRAKSLAFNQWMNECRRLKAFQFENKKTITAKYEAKCEAIENEFFPRFNAIRKEFGK